MKPGLFKHFIFLAGAGICAMVNLTNLKQISAQNVVYQGSSNWAPLDSYYDRVTYRYYPDARVYYDPAHDLYYYYYNGRWYSSTTLPAYIQRALGSYVLVDLDGNDPRYYDPVVTNRYPVRSFSREDVDLRTGQRTYTQIPLDPNASVHEDINLRTGQRTYTQIPNDPNSTVHEDFNLQTGEHTYTQIPNDPNSTVREDFNLRTGEHTYTQIPNNIYGSSSQYTVPGNNSVNTFDNRQRQSFNQQRYAPEQRARLAAPVQRTVPAQRLNQGSVQIQQPALRQQIINPQPAQRNVLPRTAQPSVRQPVQERIQQPRQQRPIQQSVTAPARPATVQRQQSQQQQPITNQSAVQSRQPAAAAQPRQQVMGK